MIREKMLALRHDLHLIEVLRSSFWAMGTKILAMIFGYVFTLLISKTFGARVLGLYNLSFAVVSIVTLVSLMGFPTAILRFVGEYADDHAQLDVLKKMLFLSTFISLFFTLVLYEYSNFVVITIFHDPAMRAFLVVMLCGIPFSVVSDLLVEFVRGLRLIKSSELIRNSPSVFKLVFMLFLIFGLRYGDLTPNVAHVGAAILACLIAVGFSWKMVWKMKFSKKSEVSTNKILHVSLPMLVTASMFVVLGLTDKLMLGILSTSYEVGIYSVAFRLASITSIVFVAVNKIVAPKFSELYWSDRMDDLKRVIRFSARMVFFLSAPFLLIYFVFSHQILLLFGKEFVQGSVALIILSAGQLVSVMSGSVEYFMNMTGSQHIFRNIVVVAAGINILLNYLLIPRFGFNGAAIATAISMVTWNVSALIFVRIKSKLYMGYLPFGR